MDSDGGETATPRPHGIRLRALLLQHQLPSPSNTNNRVVNPGIKEDKDLVQDPPTESSQPLSNRSSLISAESFTYSLDGGATTETNPEDDLNKTTTGRRPTCQIVVPSKRYIQDDYVSLARYNKTVQKQNLALENDNTILKAENDELREDLRSAKIAKSAKELELEKLKRLVDDLDRFSEGFSAESERLKARNELLTAELQRARQTKEKLAAFNLNLSEKIGVQSYGSSSNTDATSQQLQQNLNEVVSVHRECEIKMKTKESEVEILCREIDKARSYIDMMHAQQKALSANLFEIDRKKEEENNTYEEPASNSQNLADELARQFEDEFEYNFEHQFEDQPNDNSSIYTDQAVQTDPLLLVKSPSSYSSAGSGHSGGEASTHSYKEYWPVFRNSKELPWENPGESEWLTEKKQQIEEARIARGSPKPDYPEFEMRESAYHSRQASIIRYSPVTPASRKGSLDMQSERDKMSQQESLDSDSKDLEPTAKQKLEESLLEKEDTEQIASPKQESKSPKTTNSNSMRSWVVVDEIERQHPSPPKSSGSDFEVISQTQSNPPGSPSRKTSESHSSQDSSSSSDSQHQNPETRSDNKGNYSDDSSSDSDGHGPAARGGELKVQSTPQTAHQGSHTTQVDSDAAKKPLTSSSMQTGPSVGPKSVTSLSTQKLSSDATNPKDQASAFPSQSSTKSKSQPVLSASETWVHDFAEPHTPESPSKSFKAGGSSPAPSLSSSSPASRHSPCSQGPSTPKQEFEDGLNRKISESIGSSFTNPDEYNSLAGSVMLSQSYQKAKQVLSRNILSQGTQTESSPAEKVGMQTEGMALESKTRQLDQGTQTRDTSTECAGTQTAKTKPKPNAQLLNQGTRSNDHSRVSAGTRAETSQTAPYVARPPMVNATTQIEASLPATMSFGAQTSAGILATLDVGTQTSTSAPATLNIATQTEFNNPMTPVATLRSTIPEEGYLDFSKLLFLSLSPAKEKAFDFPTPTQLPSKDNPGLRFGAIPDVRLPHILMPKIPSVPETSVDWRKVPSAKSLWSAWTWIWIMWLIILTLLSINVYQQQQIWQRANEPKRQAVLAWRNEYWGSDRLAKATYQMEQFMGVDRSAFG